MVLLTALGRLARQRGTNDVQAEITRLVRVGEAVELEVTIRIDPRWYINAHRPLQERLSPTRIEVEGAQHQRAGGELRRELTLRTAVRRALRKPVVTDAPRVIHGDVKF